MKEGNDILKEFVLQYNCFLGYVQQRTPYTNISSNNTKYWDSLTQQTLNNTNNINDNNNTTSETTAHTAPPVLPLLDSELAKSIITLLNKYVIKISQGMLHIINCMHFILY